jgi:hypothetical protein
MTTYTQLLLQQYVACSCCGCNTPLRCAFVSTRRDVVTWIQCPRCSGVCTQWKWTRDGALWYKTCELAPCRGEEHVERNTT